MSSAEFWELTPREYHALSKVYLKAQDERRMLSGLVASCVLNVHLQKGKPAVQPMDFFERTDEVKCEQDMDKLFAGVEYTLRMCEASLPH